MIERIRRGRPADRFRLWLIPRRDRPLPRRWTDYLRLTVVLVVLVAATGIVTGREPIQRRLTCNDGLFHLSTSAWQAGDRCVGLSEGPYAFDLDEFRQVMTVIRDQNADAGRGCPGAAATVGVLLSMTDPRTGGRAVRELEGMAAGQRVANGPGCVHPIRLLVGQLGDYNGDGDPVAVAEALVRHREVVAVAGVGLSWPATADVVATLEKAKIPMIGDVVTAEGFDRSGSKEDNPDFSGCDADTYRNGIARDYFYRVAYRVGTQIARIGEVVKNKPDSVVVPTGSSDPYTCTALPLLQRQYGGLLPEVKFEASEASTVTQTARPLCGGQKDTTVAYLARSYDLPRLLFSLDQGYANGQCTAPSFTIVSTSDGNRLRTPEQDPVLEDLRLRALQSPLFRQGKVRLLIGLVSGNEQENPDNPRFTAFADAFARSGFDSTHTLDAWAINAYDAMTTISTALRTLPQRDAVQRSQINTAISGFSTPQQAVPGVGGPIVFDNSGNRTGRPEVVRLCPLADTSTNKQSGATTVTAVPGGPYPPDCPS
ncbi:ABC transporter substrate-binding protein [Nocardia sp. BMG51109]|uniref:ABC transporter substrate-binding protein n=1 Tax=Nocardia sp. BMG51109 TaxID=1056816 RepID=UPI000463DFAD|nr:ABC transporter substrate-binding protein [Nocardia sp. BMG51109]